MKQYTARGKKLGGTLFEKTLVAEKNEGEREKYLMLDTPNLRIQTLSVRICSRCETGNLGQRLKNVGHTVLKNNKVARTCGNSV